MNGLKARFGIAGAIVAALALVAGAILVSQAAAASGSIVVSDANITPNGGTGDVTVVGNVGDPGLGAWTVDISWDTSVLSVASCAGHVAGFCNDEFSPGTLRTNGAIAAGLTGDVVLATITFECLGGPDTHSPITISVNTFADATPGGPLPVAPLTETPGEVWCMDAPPTDTAGPAGPTATTGPPPAPGLPSTGTGTDSSSSLGWLIAAVAGAGLAAIVGFGALRVRTRQS